MSAAGSPTSAPKAMSSRLLTMKFMQRAAASSPTSSSTSLLEEPSPKRQKTAHNTPTKFNVDSLADNRAIRAALEEEESKKQAALDKAAADSGDTRWVLSFEDTKHLNKPTNNLRVIQAGFANLDLPSPQQAYSGDDDDFGENKPIVGRRSFGRFNKVLEKEQNPDLEDSSSSEESDNEESGNESDPEDSDDDPTGAKELIKASQREVTKRVKEERKAKKKAENAERLELAKKRKRKNISLNETDLSQLTSLSGGASRGPTKPPKECYGCGGSHLQRDCPMKKRGHQGDDGPPRKSQRTR